VIDPTALVALEMAPRLVAEQFSENRGVQPRRPRKAPRGNPARARAAGALRTIADALEPTPERHPAG
jgi:hypothetical protein